MQLTRREMVALGFCGGLAPALTTLDRFLLAPSEVEEMWGRSGVPGFAFAVLSSSGQPITGFAGNRISGKNSPISADMRWQLGSITKTFTGTLIAHLVDKGAIKWSTTLGDLFPLWRSGMAPGLAYVTVEHLVTHRSGIQRNDVIGWDGSKETNEPSGLSLFDRRMIVSKLAVAKPLEFSSGTKYSYSNQGYNLLGAIVQTVTGVLFEEALTKLICQPLGITPIFGEPARTSPNDQPWPHVRRDGQAVAVDPMPTPRSTGFDTMNPAGGVSISTNEMIKWVQLHTEKTQLDSLLSGDMLRTIHRRLEDRGVPIFSFSQSWPSHGRTYGHNGSNGRNYAAMHCFPEKGAGLMWAFNIGAEQSSLAPFLIENYCINKALSKAWPAISLTPPGPTAEGIIQGENLFIVSKTAGQLSMQNFTNLYGNFQLWWSGAKSKDKLIVRHRLSRAGKYSVKFKTCFNRGYGKVVVSIGSYKRVLDFDSDKLEWRAVDLGVIDLTTQNDWTFEAVDSAGENGIVCHLGLDALQVVAVG